MSKTNEIGFIGWIGSGLAAYMSWVHWHNVFYAAIHFLCGWIYVFYSLIRYGVPH